MAATIKKKLYFDVELRFEGTQTTSQNTVEIPLTLGASVSPGDRYGNILSPLPVITAGSPDAVKTQNAITAQFVPVTASTIARLSTNTPVVLVTYITPAGALINVTGQDAIYSQNFKARVVGYLGADNVGDNWTLYGVLYVQKQHSIEV